MVEQALTPEPYWQVETRLRQELLAARAERDDALAKLANVQTHGQSIVRLLSQLADTQRERDEARARIDAAVAVLRERRLAALGAEAQP